MPIRKSISAAGKRVSRQSALKLFTDRNHERELLRHFFERLARVHWAHEVRPEKPILSIWGVGGGGHYLLLWPSSSGICVLGYGGQNRAA